MTVSANAYVIKNGTVTIGGTNFSNEVFRARLVPDVNIQTQRTFDPTGTAVDVDTPVYTLELTAFQSTSASASAGLASYLRVNAGSLVTFVLTPKSGSMSASGSFMAIPPAFGGTNGEWASFEGEYPVTGTPSFY